MPKYRYKSDALCLCAALQMSEYFSQFYHSLALQGKKRYQTHWRNQIHRVLYQEAQWPRISPRFLRARIRTMSPSFCHLMPLPHSQEGLSQMTLGPYTEQIMKILSGNFRIPKCVKENVQFIYTVAFIVKIIDLSRTRTVFLKRVVEDKCLSSAAFPSWEFLDSTSLV